MSPATVTQRSVAGNAAASSSASRSTATTFAPRSENSVAIALPIPFAAPVTAAAVPNTAFQETRTFNAADVDANGLELELTALLTDNLTLRANLGTLDAEYNEFFLDRDLDGTLEDFSGRDVVRAPELTGGIDLTYLQELSRGGAMRYNLSFNYEDENVYYYNDDIGSEFDTILEERTILNANVTYRSPNDRYYVSVFGKNLTDDRYKPAAQAVGALWTFGNYGPPRVYGIEAGINFTK